MVYTCDSKSHAARLVGSSPTSGTDINMSAHFMGVFIYIYIVWRT